MKSRIIYVDFVRKSVRPNPVEISLKKHLIKSFIAKLGKIFSLNYDDTRNRKHAYNYKHTM